MAKSVKLADIAEKLNVSTVTVSKALADQKGVSEEMRERIKRLAHDMGYKPPVKTRQLKDYKSYNIGVIISERYWDQQESFYWKMYQEVATKAVSKECFTMLEILSKKNERELELSKLVSEDRVDGLIIIGLLKEDYLSMIIKNAKMPLVCLDFYDKNHDCNCVVTDNYFGMYKLTNYLFEMGHTNVGYVGTLLYTNSITDRYFGYCKALLEHGKKVRKDWIIEDRDMDTGVRDKDFSFQLPEEMPTSFVCNCDMTAGIFVEALREKGYRVPEDVSVVGFDNYPIPGVCNLGITTYEVDIREMARKTINLLLKQIAGDYRYHSMSIVEGCMILKESVRNLKE